jgi:hypothetical protein
MMFLPYIIQLNLASSQISGGLADTTGQRKEKKNTQNTNACSLPISTKNGHNWLVGLFSGKPKSVDSVPQQLLQPPTSIAPSPLQCLASCTGLIWFSQKLQKTNFQQQICCNCIFRLHVKNPKRENASRKWPSQVPRASNNLHEVLQPNKPTESSQWFCGNCWSLKATEPDRSHTVLSSECDPKATSNATGEVPAATAATVQLVFCNETSALNGEINGKMHSR